ncbi:16S rRNA (uracil(1498)-N(3))-methyltransferase [Flexithrix dorotheae]|uniref:16S rRNA (uracil(1498)-N(3))-methyltransferase n=1 Tax=Flexithrix dorotheae TaxID=70993 RepID=UPI00037A6985|nr:16S rRNA (uracil(1498)-N(3))-methyltransferase [Flexithrix dorotheae]
MATFFKEDLEENANEITLSQEESRHCVKVLRFSTGDKISLINGKGFIFQGELLNNDLKKLKIKIVHSEFVQNENPFKIHIAIAPTKNMDRIEWFVEKATEIGIDKISFIKTRYSERKHLKTPRIYNITQSALKQSGNLFLPEISELQDFRNVLSGINEEEKFIAYVPENPENTLPKMASKGKSYCVLIGPEGGFSEEELELALANGFKPVSLGKNRLRTETAGFFSCSILNIINQL